MRRTWTTGEEKIIRELYGKITAGRLAVKMGRTRRSVEQRAQKLGLTFDRSAELGRSFYRFLRKHHAEGWSDTEIAREWGACVCTVHKYRRKLKLPSNRHHPRQVARTTKANRAIWKSCGGKSPGVFRWQNRRLAMARSGWPIGLSALEVRVLDQLESGPKTSRQIRAGMGRRIDSVTAGIQTRKGVSILKSLIKRGLVVCRGKRMGQIPGQLFNQPVYALADGVQRSRPRMQEAA
jgi:hypothetical protein